MKPRPVTDWDLKCFARENCTVERVIYKRPPDFEAEDLELIKVSGVENMLRIPFVADDRDNPAPEGTVWITLWGHRLPPIDGFVYVNSDGAGPEGCPA